MVFGVSFTKYAFASGAMTVLSIFGLFATPSAQAATLDLDFNWSGLVVDGDTSNSGKRLNAYKLDGGGTKGFQRANGKKRSTAIGNIGEIWQAYGITITGLNKAGTESNSAPLGLFNSNCVAWEGTSASGFTSDCAQSKSLGDNDLATGEGSYENISYNTEAQGNLLIFEENVGNGTPDDTGSGGTFKFEIDEDKHWTFERIGILDDANGRITFTYRDGTTKVKSFDIEGENELRFFTDDQEKEIAQVAVKLNGSGAITGLRFKEIDDSPRIPEPTTALGLVVFGTLATRIKRQTQGAIAKESSPILE